MQCCLPIPTIPSHRHGLEKIAQTVAPSTTAHPFANPLLWSAFVVSGSCTAVQSIQSYEVDDQLAAAATIAAATSHHTSTNHSQHHHHHHSKQPHDHTAATSAAATDTVIATAAASVSKVSYAHNLHVLHVLCCTEDNNISTS
jgi:hypothetical protein